MDSSRTPRKDEPTDVGRTSGGGSLGHKQPPEVDREAPIRNNPPASREETSQPTTPKNRNDGAALKTKI